MTIVDGSTQVRRNTEWVWQGETSQQQPHRIGSASNEQGTCA
jgi:hypothetical protein